MCALEGWRADELCDLAEQVGPGPAAGPILALAGDMDGATQRDRVRMAALMAAQADWWRAHSALALGRACEEADLAEDGPEACPARSLIEEVALATGENSRNAHTWARVGRAALANPQVGGPLAAGRFPVAKADAALRAANRLEDPEGQRRVIALGVNLAASGAPLAALRDGCEKLAAKLDPRGHSRAHQEAYKERNVTLRWRAAGMAALQVFGAHDELAPVYERLDAAARAKARAERQRQDAQEAAPAGSGPAAAGAEGIAAADAEPAAGAESMARADAESMGPAGGKAAATAGAEWTQARVPPTEAGRELAQGRYDMLIRALAGADFGAAEAAGAAGSPAAPRSPRGQVLVRMDATTLLGLDNTPGLILGAGPIPAEVGRAIAKNATWRALFVDPATGRPVWVSEKSFQAGLVFGRVASRACEPGGFASVDGRCPACGGRAPDGEDPPDGWPPGGRPPGGDWGGPPMRSWDDAEGGRDPDRAGGGPAPGEWGGGHCGALGPGQVGAGDTPEVSGAGQAVGTERGPENASAANPWGQDPAGWPTEAAFSDSYQPSARLRLALAVRQPRCANPACRRQAAACEVDHVDEFDADQPAKEQTVLANLQHLSKGCHQLKTRFNWRYQRDAATGASTITTPLGFTHTIPPYRLC